MDYCDHEPKDRELLIELDEAYNILSNFSIETFFIDEQTDSSSKKWNAAPLKAQHLRRHSSFRRSIMGSKSPSECENDSKSFSDEISRKQYSRASTFGTTTSIQSNLSESQTPEIWRINQSNLSTKKFTSAEKTQKIKKERESEILKQLQIEKPKQISLNIISAENLPKCEVLSPYIVGFFHSDHSFRTRTMFNTITPVWNEVFEIDLPNNESDLNFMLWNHLSPKKTELLGIGHFSFSKSSPSEESIIIHIENTESNEVKTTSHKCNAKIHVKYSINEIDTNGDQLVKLLISESDFMVSTYYWIEKQKLELIGTTLIELFHSRNFAKQFLLNIIENPKSINAIIDKTSVLRKMIGVFCKYSRDSYLNIFQPIVMEIVEKNIQLEVRASYIQQQLKKSNKELTKKQSENKAQLIKYANNLLSIIKISVHDLIPDLRSLCKSIFTALKQYYIGLRNNERKNSIASASNNVNDKKSATPSLSYHNDDADIINSNLFQEQLLDILGDILFQKYICPMIASPVAFGLIHDSKKVQNQSQSNIVLAKLFVAMASGRPFPETNELSIMNEFILEKTGEFLEIYKSICIEHSAFQMLLNSKKQREKFRKHLETMYCTENLEFWEDIQQYKTLKSQDERKSFSSLIWKLYFEKNAERQLNVDQVIINEIKENLNEPSLQLFDSALEFIIHLLQTDSYLKFMNNRKLTVISSQQIHQKVRVKSLSETCKFLICNSGSLKYYFSNNDEFQCNLSQKLILSLEKINSSLNLMSIEYNPYRDVNILNRSIKFTKLPRAAWIVSSSLLKCIIDLYKIYFQSSSSFTDELISNLRSCDDFIQFINLTSELQAVKVFNLSNNQKLSFWINCYNLLTLHAFITIGQPHSKKSWLDFQAFSCYEIDGQIYSLLEIEHCVLRAGMGIGKWINTMNSTTSTPKPSVNHISLIKPFDSNDIRFSSIYSKPFHPLSLLIANGINSNPHIHVYSPGSFQKEVETIEQNYLMENISIARIAHKEVSFIHFYGNRILYLMFYCFF